MWERGQITPWLNLLLLFLPKPPSLFVINTPISSNFSSEHSLHLSVILKYGCIRITRGIFRKQTFGSHPSSIKQNLRGWGSGTGSFQNTPQVILMCIQMKNQRVTCEVVAPWMLFMVSHTLRNFRPVSLLVLTPSPDHSLFSSLRTNLFSLSVYPLGYTDFFPSLLPLWDHVPSSPKLLNPGFKTWLIRLPLHSNSCLKFGSLTN